jgi:hypothetical protein
VGGGTVTGIEACMVVIDPPPVTDPPILAGGS